MHRIMFQLGPFTVYSYGLLVAAGFLVSTVLVLRDGAKSGLSRNDVFDCLLAVLVGGLIGGRFLFVLVNWEYYYRFPLRAFMFREGGMAFQGALAGALLAGLFVTRARKISFIRTADIFAPYIALGQAIGRIGCFLNGCCYGRPTLTGPGVTFPGEAFMRVPVQLYSSFALLILFLVLRAMRDRKPYHGFVLGMYLVLYSVFRFFVEFLRGDSLVVCSGLTLPQIISAVAFAFGALFLLALRIRKGSRA